MRPIFIEFREEENKGIYLRFCVGFPTILLVLLGFLYYESKCKVFIKNGYMRIYKVNMDITLTFARNVGKTL